MISKEDLKYLNQNSEEEAILFLSQYGPEEIILTKGAQGAIIYEKESKIRHKIPPHTPKTIIDVTGAGDTFIGAYLFSRIHNQIRDSGNFATKISSLKIEKNGPLTHHHLKDSIIFS